MRYTGLFLLCLIVLLGGIVRFYHLATIPHGLYFDEASIGYNAFLIASKGVDEHGRSFPLWFEAFGEYKMPIYIYLTAAAVKLLGTTTFAVRVTSALFGTLTIISFFFLVKELSRKSHLPYQKALPYIASLLLALSSWHIQFSHAGFEATLGAFFYITGLLFALVFWRKKTLPYLVLALVCFSLTLYTYDGYRPLTSLTVFALAFYAFWTEQKLRKLLAGALAVFVLTLIPLVLFNLTPAGLARFSEVSAFNNLAKASLGQKLLLIPVIYFRNYLSYFSFSFLFGTGDGIARHQPVGFGPLPYWQLPVILLGIGVLLKTKTSLLKTLTFSLLLLAPVAAALALPSPHTLRSLLLVFPFCILSALGIVVLAKALRSYPVVLTCLLLVVLYETTFSFHTYFGQYAVNSAFDWGGEFQAVVTTTQSFASRYQHIVVNNNLGFATQEYFGYYSQDKLHPLLVDKNWHKPASWGSEPYLYITPQSKQTPTGMKLDTVYLPNNNHDIFAQFWRMP